MDPRTSANARAWNGIAKTHYEKYDINKLLTGEPLLNETICGEVGDVRGKSLIHLLCHIGTDTLSWGLLGARVTGVDISAESLRYARELASRMKMDARFIESDVMEVASKILETYDIVFCSTGVLCWIPDIDQFARIVRRLLKPGGFFYILDGHPFRNVLGTLEDGKKVVNLDYFNQNSWEYDSFTDYTTQGLEIQTKNFEWDWRLGQVVTAFAQAGLRIQFLHEYPQYFYGGYVPYDVEDNKVELFPCTFSLKAVAD